jgi:HAD superfamily hydrolase (TIGR01662 family)
MILGVIFDLGSTLIHFTGDWDQIWQASLKELEAALQDAGLETLPQGVTEEFARRMDAYRQDRLDDHKERTTASVLIESLAALGVPRPEDNKIRAVLARMYAPSEEYWKPVPGLDSTLNELQARGLRMALLSNAGDEANVQRLIDHAGIRHYLHPILISAALGVRKPALTPFRIILSQWNLDPSQVVMIGDRLDQDILGAQRAGLHQIWLQAYAEPGQSIQQRPEWIGDTLAQVPALIEQLDSKG